MLLCEDANVGATHRVVTNLAAPVYSKGHYMYMDNYFSSPGLYSQLAEKTNWGLWHPASEPYRHPTRNKNSAASKSRRHGH